MSDNNAANEQTDDAVHPISRRDTELTNSAVTKDVDPFLVTFEEPFDAENPKYAD